LGCHWGVAFFQAYAGNSALVTFSGPDEFMGPELKGWKNVTSNQRSGRLKGHVWSITWQLTFLRFVVEVDVFTGFYQGKTTIRQPHHLRENLFFSLFPSIKESQVQFFV